MVGQEAWMRTRNVTVPDREVAIQDLRPVLAVRSQAARDFGPRESIRAMAWKPRQCLKSPD